MRQDVFIVRHQTEKCAKLVEWLKANGSEIISVDDEMGVIEATVEEMILHQLHKLPCVAYVRMVFRYEPNIVVHPTDDAL
jgi:hypothetical protein